MKAIHSRRHPGASTLALGILLLGPVACGNDANTTGAGDVAANDGGTDASTPPESPSPVPEASPMDDLSMTETSDGPIVLETRVTLWSAERLELAYELSNGDERSIVVWDHAPGDTFGGSPTESAASVSDVLVEDDSSLLFKGVVHRDDCLNPTGTITVTGRPLESGGTLNGTLVRDLPLASRCENLPETDPSELRFCVGYSLAGTPELEEALSFGRAQSGEERYASGYIVDQRRSCVTLSR